ncbi:MAG: hypothetical protein JWO94_3482 [Verrucomicrobiaceae bacterium]|nr:hypothetical protein [Verrucomicrobiaceae bacterium]
MADDIPAKNLASPAGIMTNTFVMNLSRLSFLLLLAAARPVLADISADLKVLRAVGSEGKGNKAAADAWRAVSQVAASDLPLLLAAMDGANPLSANYLRAAVEVVEARETKSLPLQALIQFVRDTGHSPEARATAFDVVLRHAPDLADRLAPDLIEDPSAELRRHPVGKLIEAGDSRLAAGDKEAAVKAFQKGMQGARDEDQIKVLAKKLRGLDQPVDLPSHFGFLMHWKMIAPFSNAERKGFEAVYPPEKTIDFSASYPGKGKEAAWLDFTSTDEYGKIDFNKPFGMEKEVVGYAATEFKCLAERDAEIRIGCKDGWKVWLNGMLLFARDEYHRGAKLDQYKLPCHLKLGSNTLLVKCCQNEQKETWTVEWEFQLRICDATGTAILAAK